MKKFSSLSFLLMISAMPLLSQLKMPGVKWSDSYSFDAYTDMKIDFFAKGNELMRTFNYKTWYNAGETGIQRVNEVLNIPEGNYMVIMDAPQKGSDIQTIFDMKNTTAVQVFGSDNPEPMYNAGGFKYPSGDEIKKLELVETDETRTIAGHLCKKYTYIYKKIFGEAWITREVKLPNDFGIFRAAKMSALHNTLSEEGFVMEMTSEDSRGGKTVMTTLSVGNKGKITVELPKSKMGTALNKVSYFTF